MFSAKDLVAVSSSKVDFGDDGDDSTAPEHSPRVVQDDALPAPAKPAAVANSPPIKASKPRVANSPAPKPVAKTLAAPEDDPPMPPAATPAMSTSTLAPAAEKTVVPQAVQVADNPDDDFSGLSLEELVNNSNWKARKVGFEQLAQTSNKDELTVERFDKCITEIGMGALDPALEAASAFVKQIYDGKDENELIRVSVPKLFKKALVGRPGTKKRSMDLVLDFMEIGAPSMEATLQALLTGLEEKNPKVGAACLECFRAAIKEFGGRRLPIKVVQQAIVQGNDVKNPSIRTMATGIAVDMDMWFMGAFKDLVSAAIDNASTQKAVVKAIEDAAAKRSSDEGLPEPSRRFRGEDLDKAKAKAGSGQSAEDAADGAAPDLYDVLPEKNLLEKLAELNFEKQIQEPKWKDRRQPILDALEFCGPTPRLAQGEYSEVVRLLRGAIQNDSNQAVVVDAIKLLGIMGAGLRAEFHPHARASCGQLLAKYRDKKTAMIAAVDVTLDTYAQHCFNLTEDRVVATIDEHISYDGSSGKQKSTPLQRKHMIAWIGRVLASGSCWNTSRKQLGSVDDAGFASLLSHMVNGCCDADADVREASTVALSSLLQGETKPQPMPDSCRNLLTSQVESLLTKNPILKKKFDAASSSAPAAPSTANDASSVSTAGSKRPAAAKSNKPPAASSFAPSDEAASVVSNQDDMSSSSDPPKRGPPKRFGLARKTGPASSSATGSSKSGPPGPSKRPSATSSRAASGAAAPASGGGDDGDMNDSGEAVMPDEEAVERVSALGLAGFSEAVSAFNDAKKWQDKMSLFECLTKHVDSQDTIDQAQAHALIAYVGAQTKGFKESNFNIMNEGWNVIEKTVNKSSGVARSYAAAILDPAIKKIGDRKQDEPVKNLCLALCETCGPKYVTFKLLKAAEKIASPKTLEESFVLLTTIAEEFGAKSLNIQNVINFASGPKGLAARQAPCKVKATALLAELFRQVGEPIRQLLGDKADGNVSEAFDKVGFQGASASAPKRKVKGEDSSDAAGGGSGAMDIGDLIPRADISNLLTDKLMNDLGDESSKTAWKVRLKTIEEVMEMIKSAHNRIQLTRNVRQLTAELRKRLADTNRNLAAKAAMALAMVGNAVGGDGAATLAKGTAGSLFSYLSDGKKTVVTAIKDALEQWTVHDGQVHAGAFFAMAHQAPEALRDMKNDRTVLLEWFLKNIKADGVLKTSADVNETLHALAEPFLSCLQSRDPKVRKLAGQAISVTVAYFGREEGEMLFKEGCRDLKPAVVRSITPLLKAAYDEASTALPGGDANSGPAPEADVPAPSAPAPSAASATAPVVARSETIQDAAPAPVAPVASAKSSSVVPSSSSSGIARPGPGASSRAPAVGKAPTRSGIPGPKKRVGTLRGTRRPGDPTPAAASAAASSEPDASVSSGPPFKPANPALRQKREERGRRHRWPAIFDEKDRLRMSELRQGLRDDLEKVLAEDLVKKMFMDADGGRAARGSALDPAFNILTEELPNYGPEARECFDLLLKWSTLQLHNNNSTVTLNVLQLLDHMFELASGGNYVLSDYEAHAFLPHLLHKLGEKQTRFRDSVRHIMELLCNCYPVSKYAPFVHSEVGPSQRSAYVLTECLSELARLARIHGLMLLKVKVGVGNNIMKTVAVMVDDSRKEVRSAALEFMEAIWEHEGRDNDALVNRVNHYKVELSNKATTLIVNHCKEARLRAPAGDLIPPAPDARSTQESSRRSTETSDRDDSFSQKSDPQAPQSPPRTSNIAGPARKLRLQRPGNTSPPSKPESTATAGQGRSGQSSMHVETNQHSQNYTVESPKTPEARGTRGARGNTELKFQFDLPATPPSPQNHKRMSMANTPGFATPHVEKENDPSLESFRRRSAGTPAMSKSARVVSALSDRVSAIPAQAKAYLDLIRDPQALDSDSRARTVREAGIKALALVGATEPPSDWVESGCGGQAEWINFMKDEMDIPAVVRVLLDFLDEVTSRSPPTMPLRDEDSQDVRDTQAENRLLKLVVPAIFTIAWWPELRRLAAGPINTESNPSSMGKRWTTTLCNLLARLMERRRLQKQLEMNPGGFAAGSEAIHEVFAEQDRLLKALQTTFAKLTETPSWLSAVLHRYRRCNEIVRHNSIPELADQEVYLKRVLRRAVLEYISLQESYVEMYQNVYMAGAVAALGDLVGSGIAEGDVECDDDRAMAERLVRSLLRTGNEFTQFVNPHGATRSLHLLVSHILVEQANQSHGQATTPARETSQPESFVDVEEEQEPLSARDAAPLNSQDSEKLQQIFGRFSQAIEGMSQQAKWNAFKELNVFFHEHPGFEDSLYLKEMSGPFHKHICEGVRKVREEEARARRATQTDSSRSSSRPGSADVSERIRRLRNLTLKATTQPSSQVANDFGAPEPTSASSLPSYTSTTAPRSTVVDTSYNSSASTDNEPLSSRSFGANEGVVSREPRSTEENPVDKIKQATSQANQAAQTAQSATLRSIRERMAARKQKMREAAGTDSGNPVE